MKFVIRFLSVLAVASVAATAYAQVQTGSILVKTTDEQGAVTPGVTVTISSPVLVSGSMTAVTDVSGTYRFPSLVPGTYSVKIELSGFQTVVREGIVVLVGQTTPLDMTMKVATLAETVTVSGDSPVVDTTSANVAVNLSEQLLQGTPGGRDIWALVEYKVPSLTITRPDVGGTSGGLQGTYSARGTTSGQNSQYLNGINVGDPSAIGAAGYYYDFDAFDDIQVSTGAHDITVPTGGVFLNMVTKSGGNTWQGRTTFAWEGSGTQSSNIDDNLLKYGFISSTNKVDFVSDVNFSIGGPLIKNKLRAFGSIRDWRVHVNVPAAFSTTVLDQTNIDSGLVNITYSLNDKNRLTGFYSKQRYNKPNRFLNSPTTTLVADSTSNEEDKFSVYQALWNSVVTSNFFIDARLGYNTILFPTYLNGSAQSLTDNATGIITGNYTANTVRHRPRLQTNVTGNYYVDQALGGRHEFKFGIDVTHAAGSVETTRFDDLTANWNSQTNQSVAVTLYATPFDTATTLNNTALFAQDSYSVKRLTVTGGLRYEHLDGYLPDQSSPATKWTALGVPAFQNVPRSLSETNVVTWNTTGPRLSAAYDLAGDGRTALKGSAARYYYIIATTGTPLDSLNPNSTYQATYGWNDLNHDLIFQPGEQTGAPVITSGTTTSVSSDYRRPYTDEYTLGVDRDLGQSLKVSAVYSYRREKYQQGTLNVSNAFATTPSTRTDTGPDGRAGTADDTTYQYFDRIGTGNLVSVTNDPNATQTYKGIELTATKRLSNHWQVLAGYTYAHTSWVNFTVPNLTTPNPNSAIDMNGPVVTNAYSSTAGQTGDRPQQFKLTGSYTLPWYDIDLAANFRSQSGIALTRYISTPATVGGAFNVNVGPVGALRLDPVTTLDLRVGKVFKFGPRALETAMDLYNLFNANTAWDARAGSGTLNFLYGGVAGGPVNTLPQFGSPAQVLAPRIIRFSAAFRF
ncbi:MAG TPA: TonB-dependent receptor [Vicinamibacterales bacterium]|jgi:hypothetical protein